MAKGRGKQFSDASSAESFIQAYGDEILKRTRISDIRTDTYSSYSEAIDKILESYSNPDFPISAEIISRFNIWAEKQKPKIEEKISKDFYRILDEGGNPKNVSYEYIIGRFASGKNLQDLGKNIIKEDKVLEQLLLQKCKLLIVEAYSNIIATRNGVGGYDEIESTIRDEIYKAQENNEFDSAVRPGREIEKELQVKIDELKSQTKISESCDVTLARRDELIKLFNKKFDEGVITGNITADSESYSRDEELKGLTEDEKAFMDMLATSRILQNERGESQGRSNRAIENKSRKESTKKNDEASRQDGEDKTKEPVESQTEPDEAPSKLELTEEAKRILLYYFFDKDKAAFDDERLKYKGCENLEFDKHSIIEHIFGGDIGAYEAVKKLLMDDLLKEYFVTCFVLGNEGRFNDGKLEFEGYENLEFNEASIIENVFNGDKKAYEKLKEKVTPLRNQQLTDSAVEKLVKLFVDENESEFNIAKTKYIGCERLEFSEASILECLFDGDKKVCEAVMAKLGYTPSWKNKESEEPRKEYGEPFKHELNEAAKKNFVFLFMENQEDVFTISALTTEGCEKLKFDEDSIIDNLFNGDRDDYNDVVTELRHSKSQKNQQIDNEKNEETEIPEDKENETSFNEKDVEMYEVHFQGIEEAMKAISGDKIVKDKSNEWESKYASLDEKLDKIEGNINSVISDYAKKYDINFILDSNNLDEVVNTFVHQLESSEKVDEKVVNSFVSDVNAKLKEVNEIKKKIAEDYISITEEGIKLLRETAKKIEIAEANKDGEEKKLSELKTKHEELLKKREKFKKNWKNLTDKEKDEAQEIGKELAKNSKQLKKCEENLQSIKKYVSELKESFEHNKEAYLKAAEDVKKSLEEKGISIGVKEVAKEQPQTQQSQPQPQPQQAQPQQQPQTQQQAQPQQQPQTQQQAQPQQQPQTQTEQQQSQTQTEQQQSQTQTEQQSQAETHEQPSEEQRKLPVTDDPQLTVTGNYNKIIEILSKGTVGSGLDNPGYMELLDSFEAINQCKGKASLSSEQKRKINQKFSSGRKSMLSAMQELFKDDKAVAQIKDIIGKENLEAIREDLSGSSKGNWLKTKGFGLDAMSDKKVDAIKDSLKRFGIAIVRGELSKEQFEILNKGLLRPLKFTCADQHSAIQTRSKIQQLFGIGRKELDKKTDAVEDFIFKVDIILTRMEKEKEAKDSEKEVEKNIGRNVEKENEKAENEKVDNEKVENEKAEEKKVTVENEKVENEKIVAKNDSESFKHMLGDLINSDEDIDLKSKVNVDVKETTIDWKNHQSR